MINFDLNLWIFVLAHSYRIKKNESSGSKIVPFQKIFIFQVEGRLRFLANPHCEKRMEFLYKQKEDSILKEEVVEEDSNDEVSIFYYGETGCTCSKTAMCKSNKCICFIRDTKCTKYCDNSSTTKCQNIWALITFI